MSKMNAEHRIGVVIVHYNAREFLPGLLKSLFKQTYPIQKIVLIDNNSSEPWEHVVDQLKSPIPLEIQSLSTNVGYAKGVNIGIEACSSCDWVLVLNPDTILEPEYVERCLQAGLKNHSIGGVTGKILRFDRRTLDTTGQFLSCSRRVRERGYGTVDRGMYTREEEVFSICGAIAFYRMAMLQSIALSPGEYYDNDYFAFWEDIDLGWRARKCGWKFIYTPNAIAYHFRGGSEKVAQHRLRILQQSPRVRIHTVKNRYLTLIKNETLLTFLFHLPCILFYDIALWSLLIFVQPNTIAHLWRYRYLLKKAFQKRRIVHNLIKEHGQ